jgi:hypothetical protein
MANDSITGETQTIQIHELGCVEYIYGEEYNEDMNSIELELGLYNGTIVRILFKKRQLEQINLYLKKCEAEKRYVDHILKD